MKKSNWKNLPGNRHGIPTWALKYFEGSQQVELDLSYATPCKKVYQRYKVYGQMHMDKMKAWGE